MRTPGLSKELLVVILVYALVMVGLGATFVHFWRQAHRPDSHAAFTPPVTGAVSRELMRCQLLGTAAQGDARCAAAWAENRRRFFGDLSSASKPAGR